MNQEQITLLLKEAKFYRDQEQYDEALSHLHQVVNSSPENLDFKYLLASTYLESKNEDAAEQYADEILQKNPRYKQALELKGLICEVKKMYKEAELYYLQCIEIDPNFLEARFNLIQLYSNIFFPDRYGPYQRGFKEVFKKPTEVITHSEFIISSLDKAIKNMSLRQRDEVGGLYIFTCVLYTRALFAKKEYRKCIEIIEKSIEFSILSNRKKDIFPGFFIMDETNIFKLYYLLEDKKGMEEYQNKIKLGYRDLKDYEETMKRIIDEIKDGKIYL